MNNFVDGLLLAVAVLAIVLVVLNRHGCPCQEKQESLITAGGAWEEDGSPVTGPPPLLINYDGTSVTEPWKPAPHPNHTDYDYYHVLDKEQFSSVNPENSEYVSNPTNMAQINRAERRTRSRKQQIGYGKINSAYEESKGSGDYMPYDPYRNSESVSYSPTDVAQINRAERRTRSRKQQIGYEKINRAYEESKGSGDYMPYDPYRNSDYVSPGGGYNDALTSAVSDDRMCKQHGKWAKNVACKTSNIAYIDDFDEAAVVPGHGLYAFRHSAVKQGENRLYVTDQDAESYKKYSTSPPCFR
jgi:hypothetical protein